VGLGPSRRGRSEDVKAFTLAALAASVERQGGAVDRASGPPKVRPLLGQPDRVATLRTL
jgi:hypothetical protein